MLQIKNENIRHASKGSLEFVSKPKADHREPFRYVPYNCNCILGVFGRRVAHVINN